MMHTDSTNVNRKAAQSQATRARLVAAARELFGRRGYSNVGTEEIVRAAGVTRGALYHQFADKRDLFAAVTEAVDADLLAEANAAASGIEDPVEGLRTGLRGWVEATARPEAHRIVLVDAPAVLGWETWREIGARYGLGSLMEALQAAIDAGVLAAQPVRPLAHILMGALDEAVLYIARAEDQDAARAETAAVLDRIVDSLRATPSSGR
jgi:AcrR family transcriptional regulator